MYPCVGIADARIPLLWSATKTPRARAESVWYRTAGLATRNRKDLAVDIIEGEIRSAQHEVLLESAQLVLSDAQPIEIARHLRARAELIIRPRGRAT